MNHNYEYLPHETFENYLKQQVNINEDQLGRIKSLLRNTQSIIAGGSVLSAYNVQNEYDYANHHEIEKLKCDYGKDFDIYIHFDQAKNFADELKNIFSNRISFKDDCSYTTPPYDGSFLKKNNIIGRFLLTGSISSFYIAFDILIVKNDSPLIDVVKSFDLSFCKIWYNGTNVLTMDREGVLNKKGKLGKDYIKSFLDGNIYTIRRIDKYKRRGYKIEVNLNRPYTIKEKKGKIVSSPQEWVLRSVIKFIVFNEQTILILSLFELEPFYRFVKLNTNSIRDLINSLETNDISLEDIKKIFLLTFYKSYNYYSEQYKEYIRLVLQEYFGPLDIEGYFNEFHDDDDDDDDDDDNFIAPPAVAPPAVAPDVNINTSLIDATLSNNINEVNRLIAAGANVNFEEDSGHTALMYAVENNYMEIVRALIAAGANVDLQHRYAFGYTALMFAIIVDNIEMIRVLIQAGADVNLRNRRGESALDMAAVFGDETIVSNAVIDRNRNNNRNLGQIAAPIPEAPNEEFNFETQDIDERTFNFQTCRDLISQEDENINDYLAETNTFLFINGNPNEIGTSIICFNKDYLTLFISNKNDNWFYECTGTLFSNGDRGAGSFVDYPYLKMFINNEGLVGLVPLIQIRKILTSDHKIYYINPMLDRDGTQKMITNTASWAYLLGPVHLRGQAAVSGNHCQAGSNMLVYTLKVCRDPERCIRSIMS